MTRFFSILTLVLLFGAVVLNAEQPFLPPNYEQMTLEELHKKREEIRNFQSMLRAMSVGVNDPDSMRHLVEMDKNNADIVANLAHAIAAKEAKQRAENAAEKKASGIAKMEGQSAMKKLEDALAKARAAAKICEDAITVAGQSVTGSNYAQTMTNLLKAKAGMALLNAETQKTATILEIVEKIVPRGTDVSGCNDVQQNLVELFKDQREKLDQSVREAACHDLPKTIPADAMLPTRGKTLGDVLKGPPGTRPQGSLGGKTPGTHGP